MPIKDQQYQCHHVIGEWDDEELLQLEESLSKYAYRNFVFFKGRRILTGWRTNDGLRVVMTRSLKRMLGML